MAKKIPIKYSLKTYIQKGGHYIIQPLIYALLLQTTKYIPLPPFIKMVAQLALIVMTIIMAGYGLILASKMLKPTKIALHKKYVKIPDIKCCTHPKYEFDPDGYQYNFQTEKTTIKTTYKNIEKCYVVTEEKEKQKIHPMSITQMRTDKTPAKPAKKTRSPPEHLPKKYADRLTEKDDKLQLHPQDSQELKEKIQATLKGQNAYDLDRLVAIKIKKLTYKFPKKADKQLEKIQYPTLEGETIYISVADPQALVEEIQKHKNAG